MWKIIEKIFLNTCSDVIGIDIGTGSIKLVEVAWQKDQPILKNFGIKELPDRTIEDGRIVDAQKLTDTLSQLLGTTRTQSKNAIIAVGGRVMFARELSFPAMEMKELGEAIKWDLEKYIPYAPNTYYYDFAIVGKGDTDTEIKVLLVASPLETVDTMIHVIKSVGLKLIAVDVEPLALQRIFVDAEKAMVIDIGALLSQVTVFQNGSPAVIRNIPIGGKNFTQIIMQTLEIDFNEAEKFKQQQKILSKTDIEEEYVDLQNQLQLLVAEFARDLRRTAEYYQQQNEDAKIDKVLITGGGAKLDYLVEYLSTQWDLPATLQNPLAKLKIPGTFDPQYLAQVAPQLGTAIGLALRGGEL